jgi:hypothetical protein
MRPSLRHRTRPHFAAWHGGWGTEASFSVVIFSIVDAHHAYASGDVPVCAHCMDLRVITSPTMGNASGM